jgi:hypothetical protein
MLPTMIAPAFLHIVGTQVAGAMEHHRLASGLVG